MDWLYILMPIAGVKIFWPGLIILGIGVGVIGGFFGMGGAWMVTPGLNILGFPMAFAIGTDIAHMAGKSLISTMRHGKFGNVDYKLGCIMIIGTVAGFEIGAQMIMWLERIGIVGPVVRWMYLVLLALIAWMVFHDVAVKRRKEREAAAAGKEVETRALSRALFAVPEGRVENDDAVGHGSHSLQNAVYMKMNLIFITRCARPGHAG